MVFPPYFRPNRNIEWPPRLCVLETNEPLIFTQDAHANIKSGGFPLGRLNNNTSPTKSSEKKSARHEIRSVKDLLCFLEATDVDN